MLCLVMIGEPALAAPHPVKVAAAPQIEGRDRVLHALDRLTFGPRPGEVADVGKMGLSQWFAQQLQPETIDDSNLEARLAQFPAMSLPQQDLFARYPSPQMLRQMIATDAPLPVDPLERAIYADQIAFYKAAKANKEAGTTDTAADAPKGTMPPADANAAVPSSEENTSPQKRKRPKLLDDGLAGDPIPISQEGQGSGTAVSDTTASGTRVQADQKLVEAPGKARLLHAEQIFPEARASTILALAPDARVWQILSMQPADLVAFRRSLSQAEVSALAVGLNPQQREILASLEGSPRMIGAELLQSRLERDVYSQRQLQAVMTDFWLNHFNVYLRKNQNEPYLLPAYERETIRPLALGKFEDLLVATAESPAMLMYLDNWQSVGPDSAVARRGGRSAAMAKNPGGKQAARDRGLNENYARELMELHTVGVGCEVSQDHAATALDPACGTGYTQVDVTEVAKVFSGWTIDRPNLGGMYRFDYRRHEPGSKTVLGHRIGEAGEDEGREVLHLLATSPATAKFISTKLAVRFVSDTPPPSLVAKMSQAFLASGGDMRVVLRTMFEAPEFWSPTVVRSKVKTPLEFVVSALRASNAEITNGVPLVGSLDRMGMPLFGMQTPNGYSWSADPWVSTGALVTRMNFALVLSSDRLQGTRIRWDDLLAAAPHVAMPVASASSRGLSSSEAEERQMEILLLGVPASERTRAAVLAEASNNAAVGETEGALSLPAAIDRSSTESPGTSPSRLKPQGSRNYQTAAIAGLLLGSPEFQRR